MHQLINITPALGALSIPPDELVILTKSSARDNIFIQVNAVQNLRIFRFKWSTILAMPVQVRHTGLRLRDELDDALAFLVPVLMDPKRLKVQLFVKGDKSRHNMICE